MVPPSPKALARSASHWAASGRDSVTFDQDAANLFFQLVASRYEQAPAWCAAPRRAIHFEARSRRSEGRWSRLNFPTFADPGNAAVIDRSTRP